MFKLDPSAPVFVPTQPFQPTINNTSYQLRPMEPTDFHRGHYNLVCQLSAGPPITEEQYLGFVSWSITNPLHFVIVAQDRASGDVIASGTLLLEPKLIRGTSCVGHIEDIVVSTHHRGRGLGKAVVNELTALASSVGCYKVILACSQKNIAFYKKCGFDPKEVEMALYTV